MGGWKQGEEKALLSCEEIFRLGWVKENNPSFPLLKFPLLYRPPKKILGRGNMTSKKLLLLFYPPLF